LGHGSSDKNNSFSFLAQFRLKMDTKILLSNRLSHDAEFFAHPRFGKSPVAANCAFVYIHKGGDFLEVEADKEVEFNDLGFFLIDLGQGIKSFMNLLDEVVLRCADLNRLELDGLLPATAATSFFAAGAVNQDTAHDFGGGSEKALAIRVALVPLTGQTNPSLMNQGRCLQRVSWSFSGQLGRGESTKFLVNERQQLFCDSWICFLDGLKDSRHAAHRARWSSKKLPVEKAEKLGRRISEVIKTSSFRTNAQQFAEIPSQYRGQCKM
jgi:hypothetical protein